MRLGIQHVPVQPERTGAVGPAADQVVLKRQPGIVLGVPHQWVAQADLRSSSHVNQSTTGRQNSDA